MTMEYKFIDDAEIKLNISKYLGKELDKAGFSRVDIQKTPMITRISVHVLNPGRVIGRAGKSINELTDAIKNKFGINNPQISVIEVDNKMLEPLLVAKDLAFKLERSMNPRKIIEYTLKNIMDNGAMGAEIVLSGKLAAKGARSRVIRKSIGYIPKAGAVTDLVNTGHATAYPKYGAIGVYVRIVPPGTVFPDKVNKKSVENNIILSTETNEPEIKSEASEEQKENKEEESKVEPESSEKEGELADNVEDSGSAQ